jgi:hypothetical protein
MFIRGVPSLVEALFLILARGGATGAGGGGGVGAVLGAIVKIDCGCGVGVVGINGADPLRVGASNGAPPRFDIEGGGVGAGVGVTPRDAKGSLLAPGVGAAVGAGLFVPREAKGSDVIFYPGWVVVGVIP